MSLATFEVTQLYVQHQDARGRVQILQKENVGCSELVLPLQAKLSSCLPDLAFGSMALNETKDMLRIHFFESNLMVLSHTCILSSANLPTRETLGLLSDSTSTWKGDNKSDFGTTDSGFYDFESSSRLSEKSISSITTSDSGLRMVRTQSFADSGSKTVASLSFTSDLRNCSSFAAPSMLFHSVLERKNMSDSALSSRRDQRCFKKGRLAVSIVIRLSENPRQGRNNDQVVLASRLNIIFGLIPTWSRLEIFNHMTQLEMCLVRFQSYVKKYFAVSAPFGNLVKEASVKLREELHDLEYSVLPMGKLLSVSQGNKMFVHLLKRLEKLLDTKATKFFLSTLCSAAIMHHQDWLVDITSGTRNNHKFSRIFLFGTNNVLLHDLKTFLSLLVRPRSRSSNKKRVVKRAGTCPLLLSNPLPTFCRRRSVPCAGAFAEQREFCKQKLPSWSGNEIPYIRSFPKTCPFEELYGDDERIQLVLLPDKNRKWQSYLKDPFCLEKESVLLGCSVRQTTLIIGDLESHEVLTLTASLPDGPGRKLSVTRSSVMLSPLMGSAIEETSRVFDLTGSPQVANKYFNDSLKRISDLSLILLECLFPEPRWEIHELARNLAVHPADLPLLLGISSAFMPGIDDQFRLDFR